MPLRAFALLWLFLRANVASATGQAPDYLVVRNDTFLLHTNPLETLPDKASRAATYFNDIHTACWRGYVAYWQLDGGKLYLTNVAACSDKRRTISLARLFGNELQNGRVWANWFTGELVSPSGRLLRYYHDGYQSIYEYQTVYQVTDGMIISRQLFDNRKTKVSEYETDNEKISALIYRHIDWKTVPIRPDSVPTVFVRIESDSSGGKPFISILKGAGALWDAEALRVMALIPAWSCDYVRGKFRPSVFFYPIRFSEANRQRYAK